MRDKDDGITNGSDGKQKDKKDKDRKKTRESIKPMKN